jgi:hypothetical protein
MEDNKKICDGCNVRGAWEHRCHIHNIVIKGEHTKFDCECQPCKESREYAEKIRRIGAEEAKYGNRMWE